MRLPPIAAIRAATAAACIWLATVQVATQAPPPPSADELFAGTTLQQIWLHINSRDWQQLRARFKENTFYPCDLEWGGVIVRNAGCRSRGTGSRSGTKPGLFVEFDRYVTGQTFLGLQSLVLDNMWQDPSMIRERVSMRLFERMGLPAPRESHARLYVGSGREYAGLYAVVEDINEAFLQRTFGESGGYLYEYRWKDEYHLGDLGSDLASYALRFEPRTHETDSMFTLFAPIMDMIHAISDAAPETLETDLSPHLDVRRFLAHLATENFLAEWDGLLGYAGVNNFYLYRPAVTAPTQVIAWDRDYTFAFLQMPPGHNVEGNVLAAKAWAEPGLRRFYLQQVLLAAATAAPWLEAEVGAVYAQIREAALEDPVKPVSNGEFEQAVSDLRSFVAARPAIVRRFVTEIAPDLNGTSRYPSREARPR